MRKLILLVGVLAAVAGLWVMLASPGPEGVPVGTGADHEPDEAVAGESQVASSTGDEPAGPEAADGSAAGRAPLEVGRIAAAQGARVLVVDRSTGEPVPGAEVSYFEDFSTEDPGPPDREEYERLARDAEALAARYGAIVTADGSGMVYLPVESHVRATGRRGSIYGQLDIRRNAQGGLDDLYRLELEPDVSVTVQVLDSRDAPAIGVQVAVHPDWGPGSLRDDRPRELGATAAPDGVVEVAHLQEHTRRWTRQPPYPVGFVLRAQVPGLVHGAMVRLDDPPAEPIVLRLPATGSVTVRSVDARGELLPAGLVSAARLAVPPAEPLPSGTYVPRSDEEWRGTLQDDGTTVFDRVVPGRRYLASSFLARERVQKVFDGPLAPGEDVEATLSVSRGPFFITGRIVDEQYQAVGHAFVRADYRMAFSGSGFSVRTDSGGRFRESLFIGSSGELVLEYLRIEEATGQPPLMAPRVYEWRGRRKLGGLETDLGDLVLARGPLVASGQVLRDGEPYVGGFRQIQGLAPPTRPGREARWSGDEGLRWHWLAEGRFEIRGQARWQRYRLVPDPTGSDFLPVAPVEFGVGARDLRIELSRGGALRAALLVDDALPVGNLRIRAVPVEGQDRLVSGDGPVGLSEALGLRERLGGRRVVVGNGRYEVTWSSLWPGRYQVEVGPDGGAPLVRVPDVVIVAGEQNRDPRLQEIDLRGRLRAIRITAVDPEGNEIRTTRGAPLAILEDPLDGRLTGFPLSPRDPPILLPEPSVDLSIVAPGYRTVTLRGVTSDTTVELERAPEILLRVSTGAMVMPPGYMLRASISRVNTDERTIRVGGLAASLSSWLQAPFETRVLDIDGEAILTAAEAGTFRIRISLVRESTGRGVGVRSVEPGTFEVEPGPQTQVVDVRIPEDGLRDALERAGR